MQKLSELYEMVSLKDTALRGSEKTAILKAQLALRMFEQAMDGFKNASIAARSAADGELVMGVAASHGVPSHPF